MKFEAHRGVSVRYPENTLAAFQAAADEGYDMVELDMCFSKDKKCLILHDSTINRTARTCEGKKITEEKRCDDLTFEELRSFDYGLWVGEEFRGEQIPALYEVLKFSEKNNMPLKFDNRLQNCSDEEQEIFFKEIENYGKLSGGFTASKPEFVKKATERFPNCDIHFDGEVTKENLETVSKYLKNNDLTVWMPVKKIEWLKFPPADERQVSLAKQYGNVGLWIVTDCSEFEKCIELEADIVETDGSILPQKQEDKNVRFSYSYS